MLVISACHMLVSDECQVPILSLNSASARMNNESAHAKCWDE